MKRDGDGTVASKALQSWGREETTPIQGGGAVLAMQLCVLMPPHLKHQHYQLSDMFIYPHMCVCIDTHIHVYVYICLSPQMYVLCRSRGYIWLSFWRLEHTQHVIGCHGLRERI